MSHLKIRRQSRHGLVNACALFALATFSIGSLLVKDGEAKEFDWNDLGVSLASSKSSAPSSNLRILVSPQRRSTKNYEFEYTNASQPNSSIQGDSSYVVSNSGSPYLAQSIYQLSPNHTSSHSSAYSALSASLASLKSRLNARGVTLTSTLADPSGQPQSHLYAPASSAYSSSVLIDPSQQQSSQQQQQQQQVQSQSQQPSYLSVSSQQDPQAANPYSSSASQGNENKTIVLAIPAKINFLTGSKQSSPQQHQQASSQSSQQAPQLSVLQSSGIINSQEGSVEQVGQVASADPQEHQQYVIVNQPQTFSDHHSHSVAANLSPAAVSSSGQVYSTIYQPQTIAQPGGFSMKYLPSYSQSAGQLSPSSVQKVYSVIEGPQTQLGAQQVAPVISNAYETQLVDQPISGTRYISCVDTCNSADPRWRKYTVSRYKACCSRSSQFDPSFEQPSAEKVSESSSRYSDDAYYAYLQRRSRARRSRRQRTRQYANKYSSSAPASSSHQEEDSTDSAGAADGLAGRTSSSRVHQEPSYSKYYRSRGYGSSGSSADIGGADSAGRDVASGPSGSGKYYASKEPRTSRRGRSRDLESNAESSHQADDVEDGSVYPREPSSWLGASLASAPGYGSGEFSVDLQGRGYGADARPISEEDDATRYDEPLEGDLVANGKGNSEAHDYSGDASSDPNEEYEQDPSVSASYKYPTSNYRKKTNKARRKSAQNKDQSKPYSYKKSSSRKSKSKFDNHAGNSSDYEATQQGDYYQDSSSGGSPQDQDDHGSQTSSSYPTKESGSNYESSDSDKESSHSSKYRNNLNDTAVAHLSKTTMHLKEILSILEKKAQSSRSNDSFFSNQQQQQQQLPATSTALPPITTTTTNYPLSLLSAGSPFSSSLSTDFLSSDLSSFKSPYKFDHSSFSSSSLGSPALSMSPSFGSFGADPIGSLTPPYPSPYSLHTGKPINTSNGPHQRKRRVNKNNRYNDLMLQKAAHGLVTPSSLMHAKNRFLSSPYYPTLQYPYLYRGASQTLTNPYPYKSNHKNPYSSLLGSTMSSKLAAAANSGNLYTDESRLHGLTGLDPLANMASSLRPSAGMRLRSKPFIFQPQVLPIYTRHSILTQPIDGKA